MDVHPASQKAAVARRFSELFRRCLFMARQQNFCVANSASLLIRKDITAHCRGFLQVALEAIENIRTVHALSLHQRFHSEFSHYLDGPHQSSIRKAVIQVKKRKSILK